MAWLRLRVKGGAQKGTAAAAAAGIKGGMAEEITILNTLLNSVEYCHQLHQPLVPAIVALPLPLRYWWIDTLSRVDTTS